MAEVHTKSRRVVDDQGKLLFLERASILVDGDEVKVDSERRVARCPTCGSRLDKVRSLGRCWECGKEVCANCGIKAACCGRTLCEEHRHMSVLGTERVWVCSEHEPNLSLRQAFHDANVLFDQQMKERVQSFEEELRKRDMELKELMASSQKALTHRQQDHKEEIQKLEAKIKHRDMKLKEYMAGFERSLGWRKQAYQEALARQKLYLEHARLRMQQLQAIAPTAFSLLANGRQRHTLTGRRN